MRRSGHAPGHVREMFDAAIEAFLEWDPRSGEPEPTVEFEVHYVPRQIPISKACGLLWNCSDVISREDYNSLCDVLKIKRQTYSACAQAMLAEIKSASVGR